MFIMNMRKVKIDFEFSVGVLNLIFEYIYYSSINKDIQMV